MLYDLIQDPDVKVRIQSAFAPTQSSPHVMTDDLAVVKADVETLSFRKFPALIAHYELAANFWKNLKNQRDEGLKLLKSKLDLDIRRQALDTNQKLTEPGIKSLIEGHEEIYQLSCLILDAKERADLYTLIAEEYQHGFNALTEEQRKDNAHLKSGILEAS